MTATNQFDFREILVLEADKYIKRVKKDAVYYSMNSKDTLIYYPLKETFNEHHKYTYYEIEGKLYASLYSNKYDELIKFYEMLKKKLKRKKYKSIKFAVRQLTIFDFMEGCDKE